MVCTSDSPVTFNVLISLENHTMFTHSASIASLSSQYEALGTMVISGSIIVIKHMKNATHAACLFMMTLGYVEKKIFLA